MNEFHSKRFALANEMAATGAKLLEHTGTAAALAAIPDTAPQQYVVAGTLAMIAKVLPAESSVPPLTAPAPLTDAWPRDMAEAKQWITGLRKRVDSLLAVINADQAAPAPQQSELTNDQIDAEIIKSGVMDKSWPTQTALHSFARAIESKLAKAAPAAPAQTAEPFPEHWRGRAEWIATTKELGQEERGRIAVMLLRTIVAAPVQTAGQIRAQALEEAAEHLDRLNEASGDAAARDQRDMHPGELEREYAFSDCAKAIRALIAPSTGEASKGESA